MDNDGGNASANDQSRKELSISLAASSMINASDMISAEAYQANLHRIQEVKEMVRELEINNEAAHKNFLVGQLERRAKEGREAEDMLARLRNQPGLSEAVQFTNNAPNSKSEVILPTTATLVEVPEPYSSPAYSLAPMSTSHPPQTAQQTRSAQYQWGRAPQFQSSNPDVFRHYISPVQQNAVPHVQVPVGQGQPGWYTQNQSAESRVHNPPTRTSFQQVQTQQPSQLWNNHPHQVTGLPATGSAGYYASTAGYTRTASVQSSPNSVPSSSTYHEPSFSTPATGTRPPVSVHTQPSNIMSQVQASHQSVPLVPLKSPFDQSSRIGSHPKPPKSQPRPASVAIFTPATSELQGPQKLPQQPQQQQSQVQRQPLQPQRLPQHALQSQQHSVQTQFQLQPQLPLQPPPKQPPPPANRAPSTSVTQPHTRPSQPPRPGVMQEQAQKQGTQFSMDQATFIRLFQSAVQHGTLQLKAFWFQAKASGISDEWFRMAIDSLPQNVWQSVAAQANQSGPTLVPPQASRPQQQVIIPSAPVVSSPPPPSPPPSTTVTPVAQIAPVTKQATKPSIFTKESITFSTPKQASEPYAAQLQYYAEQATKSTLSAQVASTSKSLPDSLNAAPTQPILATPKQDVSQVQANVKTPKDADKSTLARDVLRALGKIVEKPRVEGEPADRIKDSESCRLSEVAHPITSHPASTNPLSVPVTTNSVVVNSLTISSAKLNVQDNAQLAARRPGLIEKVVLKEHGRGSVIAGPIMIDLTSEDSDESIDGKGQEPTLPMQSSAKAAVPSQPISPTNTTNHTPLLESLSLEEPLFDVEAARDNADVRMYSPPLSLPAEENMDAEPLYPSPSNAESTLPSFEPMPSERNEHPPGGQLPLFLPSPPVSPADTTMMIDEGKTRPFLKRRSVEGGKAEIDTDVEAPPRVRKRQKQQVYVLIPPAPLYVKIAKMKGRVTAEDIESDLEELVQDEEFQYSHLEQLLIEESKLRLLERRCRWLNCGAILNCAANLFAHLKEHAREEVSQAPFLCHWANCQRVFHIEQERDVHFERHTIRPLPCPFAGCNKQFDKPVEVMQHEVQHQQADRRELLIHKSTCQPIVPAIPARLGPPPRRLPSHRVVPRRVAKCQISADRHAVVGPWVLWNIFSPVDLNMRKQNASMRGRPMRQAINYDLGSSDPRRDDYDFLLALSSYPAKSPQLDDLDSTFITMSAARGLTLWGSGGTITATPEESVGETNKVKVEGDLGDDVTRENSITPEGQSGQSMVIGEEDVVERMLIL